MREDMGAAAGRGQPRKRRQGGAVERETALEVNEAFRTTAEDVVEEIRAPRLNQELAELVQRRIYVAYGGNQSAFARGTGLRQQYIANLLAGKVGIPEEPKRTVLARELGIPTKAFFVLAGELTREEVDSPWQAALTRPMSSTEVQIAEILRDLPNDYVRPIWELVQKFAEVAREERAGAEEKSGQADAERGRAAAARGRPPRR